ncbi:MAG: undecaprenyl-diphosphatase [Thermoleophilaceae bacterium]|jgi:undecaprenyl-diphosphatase|nr:undecaprenyl-diphosphatase [Thermoleophilaceae bacterium]
MSIIQSIVLGIVQGLTEFLPISSTGHVRIVPALLGWQDPGTAFTAIIQLGTMAAVVIYFRADLWRIARAWLGGLFDAGKRAELDSRMGWYLIVGTIPVAVLGLAFKGAIETYTRSLYLIGGSLIVFGLILAAADRYGSKVREVASVRLPDGLIVGCAQALALVPGVSRSGATITGALFLGFKREDAARFSFLLSIPAVVLSGLFELKSYLAAGGLGAESLTPLIVATVVAFISGYAAIALFLRYLANHSLAVFVVYRIALGVAVLLLAGSGAIS